MISTRADRQKPRSWRKRGMHDSQVEKMHWHKWYSNANASTSHNHIHTYTRAQVHRNRRARTQSLGCSINLAPA